MRGMVGSLFVTALLCIGACRASGVPDITFATLDYAALRTRIAPGGTGRLEFVAHTATSGTVYAEGIAYEPGRALAEYTFVPLEPLCRAPQLTSVNERAGIVFEVGPLPERGTVRCRYDVVRSSASRHDFALELCARGVPCGSEVRFGTLPDLALAVTAEGTSNVFRLTVTNRSDVAVESASVATHCFDAAPPGNDPYADFLDVDADVEGGCPTEDRLGTLCYRTDFVSRAFAVGPIAAGGSASCLVRLKQKGLIVPFDRSTLVVQLAGDRDLGAIARLDGDGTAFDGDTFNDMGFLRFAAQGIGDNPIPVGGAVPWLIALGLLGFGVSRLRGTPV